MDIKNTLHNFEYPTFKQIAKEWCKENYDSYKNILCNLSTAFWQGHFDQEAYILVTLAPITKNKKEVKKHGTKVNRESMLRMLQTMAAYMPDEVRDDNTSPEEKYKAMAALTPAEYKDPLIEEMETIAVPRTKIIQILNDATNDLTKAMDALFRKAERELAKTILMAEGRKSGAESSKQNATIRKQGLISAATHFFTNINRAGSYANCITWINSQPSLKPFREYSKGKTLTDRSIERIISGTKNTALSQLAQRQPKI